MIKKLEFKKQGKMMHGQMGRVLGALVVTFLGTAIASAAEPITSKVILTDKNTTIDKNIEITDTGNFTAVKIDKSAFGKNLYINADSISVDYTKGNFGGDIGIIDTEAVNGFTGNIFLKDGITISGSIKGQTKNLGFGLLLEDVDDLNKRNTGKPIDGTVFVGDSVNIKLIQENLSADIFKVNTDLAGMRISGETVKAGNRFTIDVKADTNNVGQVSCIQEGHYADISIGDYANFNLENKMKSINGISITDVILSSLQFSREDSVDRITGSNKLNIGHYGNFHGKFTSDSALTWNQVKNKQEFEGLRAENTDAVLGNHNTFTLDANGSLNYAFGLSVRHNSLVNIGDYLQNRILLNGHIGNICAYSVGTSQGDSKVSELKIGNHSLADIRAHGDAYTSQSLYGTDIYYAKMSMGDDATIHIKGINTGTIGNTVIIGADSYASNLTVGNRFNINIESTNYHTIYGIYEYKGNMSLGNNTTIGVSASNNELVSGTQIMGVNSKGGFANVGNNLNLQLDCSNYDLVMGLYSIGRLADGRNNITIGDGLHLNITEHNADNNIASQVVGVYSAGNVSIGDNAIVELHTTANEKNVLGLYSGSKGTLLVGDNAHVIVDSPMEKSHVVRAAQSGKVIFSGSAYLQGNNDVVSAANTGSLVSLVGTGRKVLLGNVENAKEGTIKINLDTADSLLRGTSTITSNNGDISTTDADTELTLTNGALWDMTGNSQVTALNHSDKGVVDMTYDSSWNRLDVHQYDGNSGIFRMDTDLQSETDGDKIYMDGATEGSVGLIQVSDDSVLKGQEVTGTKKLLLVTDESQKATFRGLSLDEGGLWEVTPTIQNGEYVRNVMGVADAKDTEWYLTMLTRSVNVDTQALLDASNQSYGLYRAAIDTDTLRKRMGDLRLQKKKEDISGIWARTNTSEYEASGYQGKRHVTQLGYDYAANPKSVYGFLWERGITSSLYENGSGKNHSSAAAIYGTWFGDSGCYTDVVAKWGRDDVRLSSYGSYPDSATYRGHMASISVEYGRTKELNDKGYFIEPQTQLILGHLGKENYTTARGKNVHMDSYNSGIFRLGFVLGKRKTETEKPYDYYLKASVLHEFGGNRDIRMSAPDGETLNSGFSYRGTWYTAGLGFTRRMNDNTYIYADAERSYGGDWHKKWQGNIGINWRF